MPTYAQVLNSERGKKRYTELHGHVAFFDRDGDGIIWPSDTYKGFRSIGFGVLLSLIAALLINGAFSWFTLNQWLPDPYFRLHVDGMANAKHGSDSETFDHKGRFDEKRFEDIFATYADPPHNALTYPQVLRMVHGNADPWDAFGWSAGVLEWTITYLLFWPEDGKMKKEDIKGIYDGSIFWTIEERNKSAHKTT